MKNRVTALELIRRIKREVEHTIVDRDQMLLDIKLMNIRIRQLSGNVSLMEHADGRIIEGLWRLGKIDQIMASEFPRMEEKEQGVFLRYLSFIQEEYYKKAVKSLESLPAEENKNLSSIEFEISRSNTSFQKKRAN
jgi:hypothetical protein